MKKNIGITLEGGGMRGMFTAGVLDVFMENGITCDGAVGVSAGAVFGCNLKSHQIGRVIRYNKRFCNDKRYASISNWIKTGDLYSKDFAYGTVPFTLDPFDTDTYQKEKMRFSVVCTDIETGEPIYHDCEKGDRNDIEWMRASASIPIVAKPVSIENHLYLDGGISDSIPIRWMQKQGYQKHIVVLTRPIDYQKKPLRHQRMIFFLLRKYPNLVKALRQRHLHYNETLNYIKEQEQLGNIFVIRPSQAISLKVIEKDPNQLEAVYQLGRQNALQQLASLKHFLAS